MVFAALPLAMAFALASPQPATDRPAFEVATVKRLTGAQPASNLRLNSCSGGPGTSDPGIYACHGLTLETLIEIAYRALPANVSGPSWIESERYDIFAKPPAGATAAQIPAMLQSLLEERFGLQLRRESKPGNLYELRAPKGAAKLTPSPPLGQPDDPEAARARGRAAAERRRTWGPGVSAALIFEPRMSMSDLAETLSKMLDHPVRNETGLAGTFAVELMFARSSSPLADTDAPHATTVFEALEELGLKLEPAKGATEKMVVAAAQKDPREN